MNGAPDYDVIVVGAGHNGLAATALLAGRGFRVLCLEKNAYVGGMAGTREILECFFEGRPIRDEYLIVQGGHLAGTGAHSYSEGDATKGSEEAARFHTPNPMPIPE